MDKWTRKYLKLAKCISEDNDACYSRTIGSVLVSPDNLIISLGYNGSARKIPHADTKEYLQHLWSILEQDDFTKLKELGINSEVDLIKKYEGCKTCPRRILNIPSGQRLDLCPCSHSERNCIFNAARHGISTNNSTMYCHCQIPCSECSIAIIQSGVKKVVCCDFGHPLYSKSSPGLLRMAGVEVEIVNPLEI